MSHTTPQTNDTGSWNIDLHFVFRQNLLREGIWKHIRIDMAEKICCNKRWRDVVHHMIWIQLLSYCCRVWCDCLRFYALWRTNTQSTASLIELVICWNVFALTFSWTCFRKLLWIRCITVCIKVWLGNLCDRWNSWIDWDTLRAWNPLLHSLFCLAGLHRNFKSFFLFPLFLDLMITVCFILDPANTLKNIVLFGWNADNGHRVVEIHSLDGYNAIHCKLLAWELCQEKKLCVTGMDCSCGIDST